MKNTLGIVSSALLLSLAGAAEYKKTMSTRTSAYSAEQEQAAFHLPEGFVIELVASEENGLINPIDIAFDDAGRMWTQTAEMYPLDPNGKGEYSTQQIKDFYALKTKGSDKVVVIDNPTERVQGQIPVFMDGLALPQSVLPYKNGVYVAHGTEMFFIDDTDGDGKGDRVDTVLTGFGFNDTHTMSHTLVRGPGGWIHFSHGALNTGTVTAVKSGKKEVISRSQIARFSLDGTDLQVRNCGHNNIWGFHLKENGQWFGTEANDRGCSLVQMSPMTSYTGIGGQKIREYQPFAPPPHSFRVTGTGISGLAYDENGAKGFPQEWKGIGFLANPITNTINCVISDRNADGSIISEHREDFLTCDDEWFRPVNIEFGPDGCLYIVDWYNKIVSHNEVSRDHPDRDKAHGRIWRVRHQSQNVKAVTNYYKANQTQLLSGLKSDILWDKRAAWHQIVDRGVTTLVPQLEALTLDQQAQSSARIHSLWALEGLGAYNVKVLTALIFDEDFNIRREALRSLTTYKPSIEDVIALTKPLLADAHHAVREQALRTLEEVGVANEESIQLLVAACEAPLNGNRYNGGYERAFQRFLARKALECYPALLNSFLNSEQAKAFPPENLEWALQALPPELRAEKILTNMEKEGKELDAESLASLAPYIGTQNVKKALGAQLADIEYLKLALEVKTTVPPNALKHSLSQALVNAVNSPDQRALALEVAGYYRSEALYPYLTQLLEQKQLKDLSSAEFLLAVNSVKREKARFHALVNDATAPVSKRIKAICALGRVSSRESAVAAERFMKSLPEGERAAAAVSMAQNEHSARPLIALLAKEMISVEIFSAADAQKIAMYNTRHPQGIALQAHARALNAQAARSGEEKIKEYVQAVSELKGNSAVGGGIFTSCLACHNVAGKGHEIAPALDGSATRDLHHLLTAIVKPNDAIESGYRLYRVTKDNGEFVEGYMESSNRVGVNVAFMGGGKVFIPYDHITKREFVNGQSFMPSHFGNLPKQTMVDLVTYIKTELN